MSTHINNLIQLVKRTYLYDETRVEVINVQVRVLKEMIKSHKPDLLFLSET